MAKNEKNTKMRKIWKSGGSRFLRKMAFLRKWENMGKVGNMGKIRKGQKIGILGKWGFWENAHFWEKWVFGKIGKNEVFGWRTTMRILKALDPHTNSPTAPYSHSP